MAFIHLDPQTMKLTVHHKMGEPWIPSEHTIAIQKFAEMVEKDTSAYMEKVYNPKIKKLMGMIDKWNRENNEDYRKAAVAKDKARKKIKKKPAKKAAPKKKTAKVKKKPTKSK